MCEYPCIVSCEFSVCGKLGPPSKWANLGVSHSPARLPIPVLFDSVVILFSGAASVRGRGLSDTKVDVVTVLASGEVEYCGKLK